MSNNIEEENINLNSILSFNFNFDSLKRVLDSLLNNKKQVNDKLRYLEDKIDQISHIESYKDNKEDKIVKVPTNTLQKLQTFKSKMMQETNIYNTDNQITSDFNEEQHNIIDIPENHKNENFNNDLFINNNNVSSNSIDQVEKNINDKHLQDKLKKANTINVINNNANSVNNANNNATNNISHSNKILIEANIESFSLVEKTDDIASVISFPDRSNYFIIINIMLFINL